MWDLIIAWALVSVSVVVAVGAVIGKRNGPGR